MRFCAALRCPPPFGAEQARQEKVDLMTREASVVAMVLDNSSKAHSSAEEEATHLKGDDLEAEYARLKKMLRKARKEEEEALQMERAMKLMNGRHIDWVCGRCLCSSSVPRVASFSPPPPPCSQGTEEAAVQTTASVLTRTTLRMQPTRRSAASTRTPRWSRTMGQCTTMRPMVTRTTTPPARNDTPGVARVAAAEPATAAEAHEGTVTAPHPPMAGRRAPAGGDKRQTHTDTAAAAA